MAEFTGNSTSQKSEESNLIVALRIRPMNDDEIMQGATPIAHRVDDNLVVLMDPMDDDDVLRQNRSREKQFMFDLALDGQSTQEEVYNKTCKFLIPGVINGFNATVFAYGATGAGKTYTMLGKDDHPGIMARALTELFSEMKRSEDDLVYKVTMSYLEIYNELIRDLLNPGSGFLDLREDQKGVQVAGLSEHSASNTEEVMEILKGGNKERTQEPTAANKTSSRSHAVLIVSVKQRHRLAGIHQQVRVGKLFLIDLAGSERAANTQNRGKRMVEGAHINRSLLALGNCINALSDKNGSKYINYRDSKLTRLLKDALGGNCKTVMIAHISPASFYFEESRNTLTYADRAKNIRTKVRQNVLDMTLHIAQYSSIITELRDEIRRLRQKVDQQQQHISSQKHMTSQSELREDNEFARLRNDLLNVFRTQMDLRQSLMELTNTDAEIGAETTRLEILIQRLEHEQQLSTSQQQRLDEQENDRTNSDANLQEHVDINRAKDDLESLVVEQKKSERMKANLEKELANATIKTKKIEEELRQLCSTKSLSSDQQEIVTLLSKLHAIQIENTQLKSNLIQCKFDTRRRDLHLDWQRHHMGVARLLVHQQRALIDENDLTQPPELGDLYDVYEKQATEINKRSFLPAIHSHKVKSSSSDSIVGVDNSSGYPLPRLFVHSSNGYKDSHPVSTDNRISDETNKLFVPRNPAGGELRDGQAFLTQEVSPRSVAETPSQVAPSGVYQPRNREVNGGGDTNRYDEIEDLILNGESRKNMVHGTRGIAQLAAHRRANKQIRNGGAQDQLTQSRLALHDRKYTPMTLVPARNDDVMSFSTNTTTDALTSYQAKNRSRRRQAGTRLATKPQMMLQRDYDAGKYRSKQSQMTHDNAARGSMSRVPVLRGGRNSRPHRAHFSVPHHDVNFNDASQPTNDAMLSPVDESQTHKSIRGNNTTRKPYQTATTVNNENDFMAVTGLGLQ